MSKNKSVITTEIKNRFSLSQFVNLDPFTGVVYDSLSTEMFLDASEKVGILQPSDVSNSHSDVLSHLPPLHYN